MYKNNIKAAILVAQDVQDEEFLYPYYRLQEAEFELDIVASLYKENPKITGKYGIPIKYTHLSEQVIDKEYDLIVIPGGWAPEIIRMDKNALILVNKHYQNKKLLAAICHGPQVIISAKAANPLSKMTGFIGIRDDIYNAGYRYIKDSVVKDRLLITANHYNANPEFMKTILNEFKF